jgi:hypothetical protein
MEALMVSQHQLDGVTTPASPSQNTVDQVINGLHAAACFDIHLPLEFCKA